VEIKALKVAQKILESSRLAYIETKILMTTLKQSGKTSPKMQFSVKATKILGKNKK
jgi:NMD protein affecting ribosome stability and mRNA decay